jgi:hypothetical protein
MNTQTSSDLTEYTAAVVRLADYLKSIQGKPFTNDIRDELKELQVAERQAKRQHKEGLPDSYL